MKETFGERLIRLRKRSGLTQVEVAASTGLTRTFLTKMERGNHPATWEKMCALADLYDVTLDYLRFGDSVAQDGAAMEVIKDSTEVAMVRAWRVLNDEEKRAFALLIDARFVRRTM